MAKGPLFTAREDELIREAARLNTTDKWPWREGRLRCLAEQLGRTPVSVYVRARRIGAKSVIRA